MVFYHFMFFLLQKIIELTDGWYPIKTVLDQPLSYLLTQKKIFVGLKLCTYGAEIIGSEQGCSPLEVCTIKSFILSLEIAQAKTLLTKSRNCHNVNHSDLKLHLIKREKVF